MRQSSSWGSWITSSKVTGGISAEVSAVATMTYCTDALVTPWKGISAEVFAFATATTICDDAVASPPQQLKCVGTGRLDLDHGMTTQFRWRPQRGDTENGSAN